MKKSITVFVHHEIYDNKANSYWIDCVKQAKKFNDKVVLCGSPMQKALVEKICDYIDADLIDDSRWNQFRSAFKNYTTTYSDSYLLAIHKRFFLMLKYMQKENIPEIILLDSDVLSYVDWSSIMDYTNIDCACCINENQFFTDYGDSDGLRWVANAGVSYWKRDALDNFIDFLIFQYQNPKLLLTKFQFHKAHNIPGGVCEMSLLYLWLKSPNLRVENLALEKNRFVVNSNYSGTYNYYEDEYKINMFGNKRIKFIKGCQYPIFFLKDGTEIKGYNIHLAGNTKRLMHSLQKNNRIPVKYCIREFLALIKRKIVNNR